jgi:hypothetical protein
MAREVMLVELKLIAPVMEVAPFTVKARAIFTVPPLLTVGAVCACRNQSAIVDCQRTEGIAARPGHCATDCQRAENGTRVGNGKCTARVDCNCSCLIYSVGGNRNIIAVCDRDVIGWSNSLHIIGNIRTICSWYVRQRQIRVACDGGNCSNLNVTRGFNNVAYAKFS